MYILVNDDTFIWTITKATLNPQQLVLFIGGNQKKEEKTVGRKLSSRCIFSSDTFNGRRPTAVVCSARCGYVDEFSPS